MKTLTFFFSLILASLYSLAQNPNNSQDIITAAGTMLYTFDVSDKSVVGTPYIQESFLPARVSAKSEKIFNLRYNAVNDEMELESEQTKNPTINKNISGLVVTFLKENKSYKSMTYFTKEGTSVTGFLVPLTNSNSNIKLFLKERIAFFEGKPAKSSYQDAKAPKFDRVNDEYFMAINNEIAKPLSNNKKDVAALFPNHEKDILNYISAEKLNLKKQDDLVKLATFLNQMPK